MAVKQLGPAASGPDDAIRKSELEAAGGGPAGADKQIQFKDGTSAGVDPELTWDKATNTLGITGADSGVAIGATTTEPASPAAGLVRLYARSYAGRMSLKTKGPAGIDTPIQNALWSNNTVLWTPTTATAGFWQGTTGSGNGTYSTALPTTTNIYTSMKRARYANVVTTANQILGQRNTEQMFYRGAGVGGGFFFFTRMGFDAWTNGCRFFAGLYAGTTGAVISSDPSTQNNTVGFAIDAADNGAISFLTRGTAATKASTGFTASANAGYDCYIFCAPNTSQISWRIVDINTGTEASGTATANLPAATTMMSVAVLASNAAVTPVTSVSLGVNRIYVETDY